MAADRGPRKVRDSGLLPDWPWEGLCALDTAGGPSHSSHGTCEEEEMPHDHMGVVPGCPSPQVCPLLMGGRR